MKKIYSLFFFLFMAGILTAAPNSTQNRGFISLLEFYSSYSMNIPKTVYEKGDFGLSTFSLIYGTKLLTGPFDFRYYHGSESIKFLDAENFDSLSDFQDRQKKCAWSLNLDFSKITSGKEKIPLSLSVGTLSYGKTISRLSSPSFYSSPSPFTNLFLYNAGLGISLAQKTAAEKPFSVAASYKTEDFTVEASVSEESDFKAGLALQFKSADFVRNTINASFTTFDTSESKTTSWKTSYPYFSDQKLWGAYLETGVSIPFFILKTGLGALKNPFNTVRFFTTFESMFHYNGFNLLTGIFACDTALSSQGLYPITSSSNSEKTIFQLRLNPQKNFYIKDVLFKTGICALYDYSLKEAGYNNESVQNLSLSGGVSAKFNKNYISFLYKLQDFTLTEYSAENANRKPLFDFSSIPASQNPSHSFSLRYSRYLKNCTATFTAKESFSVKDLNEKNEHEETFSIYSSFRNLPLSTVSFSTEFQHKKQSVTPKFTLGASASIPLKSLKISGKIQVCTTVLVE